LQVEALTRRASLGAGRVLGDNRSAAPLLAGPPSSSMGLHTENAPGLFVRDFGAGPPLLLLHGLMATGDLFRPVVAALATQHRLIVPDLRGHGRSAHLPGPYTPRQMATDLGHLLDDLGLGTVDVLGYSHGGAVAQQFALDHPRCLRRLVLSCTYAYNLLTPRERVEGFLTPRLIRLLGPRFLAASMLRSGAGGGPPLPPDVGRWLVDMLGSNRKAQMVAAARAMTVFDSRPRLKEIAAPTLVIAGSLDTAVPIAHARMLAAGIPHAGLRVIEGAGHFLILTHPDALVSLVKPWLSGDYPPL
jgi:3-oxoadipate enol-lactonase